MQQKNASIATICYPLPIQRIDIGRGGGGALDIGRPVLHGHVHDDEYSGGHFFWRCSLLLRVGVGKALRTTAKPEQYIYEVYRRKNSYPSTLFRQPTPKGKAPVPRPYGGKNYVTATTDYRYYRRTRYYPVHSEWLLAHWGRRVDAPAVNTFQTDLKSVDYKVHLVVFGDRFAQAKPVSQARPSPAVWVSLL